MVIMVWKVFLFLAVTLFITAFVSKVKAISSFGPLQLLVISKFLSVIGSRNALFMDVMG